MNRIPLYDEEEKYSDNRILQYFHEDSSHLGLWFTRFFNQYDARWQVNKENHANEQEEGKKAWINLTAKKEIDKEINNETSVNRKCGDDKALSEYQFRMLNLLKSLKGKKDQELNSDDFAICETNWNFVTGMGLPHPVENGMSWHHSLGVPYLAGSSIKGLLRAWVEGGWDEESDRKKRAKRRQKWFGMVKGEKWDNEGEEKDDKDQVGQLIFFDAVPIAPVELIPDIMTPHYGQWYAEGNKITSLSESEKIPADWHDPVPIPFLAVKKAKFLVTVVARNKECDEEAKLALQELVKALEWLGAGAKTAAGYGHLVRNDETKKEEQNIKKAAEEKEILNELSDLEREVYLSLSEVNQSEGEKTASNWLDKMEAVELKNARKIAMQLKAFYEIIGKWKNPSKKKQKPKVDRVKKILGES